MRSRNLGHFALFAAAAFIAAIAAHAERGRLLMRLPGAPCDIGVSLPIAAKGRLKALYPTGTKLTSAVNTRNARKASEADYRISATPLGPALASFLCATGGEVTLPDAALTRRSPGVEGRLPSRQALERLLSGTGLSIAKESEEGFVLKY